MKYKKRIKGGLHGPPFVLILDIVEMCGVSPFTRMMEHIVELI